MVKYVFFVLPIDDQTIDKVGTVLADRDVVASIWNLRKT